MKPNSFLALVPRDAEAAAAARRSLCLSGMSDRLASDALLLFLRHDTPPPLSDGVGAIIGTLFDSSSTRIATVCPDRFRHWRATRGAALLERHWGSYLALLPSDDGVTILREPSGGVACYHVATELGLLLASDAALITASGLVTTTIDWDGILTQAVFISLRTARTALGPIRELLPGTALHTDGTDARVNSCWTPYPYADGWNAGVCIEQAAEGLRRVVNNVVRARRDPHAQMVADACGIPLHRLTLDTAFVDLGRSASARLPRPTARIFGQASDLQIAALGRACTAEAFFSGGTGDTVLWYFNTVTPAFDRLAVEGIPGFLGTIRDLAAMCAVPRTRALALAGRKLLQCWSQPWPHDCPFLAPDVSRSLPPIPPHPWWPAPRGSHRGVKAYIRALIQMQDHFEYYDRSEIAPLITPFYAQPVIEFCLGVPSWLWCAGGHNRAVARHAFADMLPRAILERRTKGGFDGFSNELLMERRGEAHARLREGRLARAGLLDLASIGATLAGEQPADFRAIGQSSASAARDRSMARMLGGYSLERATGCSALSWRDRDRRGPGARSRTSRARDHRWQGDAPVAISDDIRRETRTSRRGCRHPGDCRQCRARHEIRDRPPGQKRLVHAPGIACQRERPPERAGCGTGERIAERADIILESEPRAIGHRAGILAAAADHSGAEIGY